MEDGRAAMADAGPNTPDAGPSADAGNPAPDGRCCATTHVRLIHLIDAPSLDFCLRRHDPMNKAPYDIGPLLASRGSTSGIPQGAASTYFDLPAGAYDVRLTTGARQGDCSQSLSPFMPGFGDTTSLPIFDTGAFVTIMAAGNLAHLNLTIRAFTDERTNASDLTAALRFINSWYPSFDEDFGFNTGATFEPVFRDVKQLEFGIGDTVDAFGYKRIGPVGGVTAVARHAGSPPTDLDITGTGVTLLNGGVYSFFMLGGTAIVLCHDSAPPVGLLSSCETLPRAPRPDAGTEQPVDAGAPDEPPVSGTIFERILIEGVKGPIDIVAGADGAMWFAETSISAVGRLTVDGQYSEFPVRGPGDQHVYVDGLSVSPYKGIWFGASHGVARMAVDGSYTTFALPTQENAGATTTGPDGNIWFVEEVKKQIGRLTPSGEIATFRTVPPDDLNHFPKRITAGLDGNLWFTESPNRVGRITPLGDVTHFTVLTPDSGPWGIVCGPDGNIWFTEEASRSIGQVTLDGVVTEFPILPPEADLYAGNYALIVHDGDLWFTQKYRSKIVRMRTDGTIVREYTTPLNGQPWGLAAGPDGMIWYTDFVRNAVGRLVP
jgi:streptogramin lyase